MPQTIQRFLKYTNRKMKSSIDDGDAEFDNGELEYVGDLPQHITTHFNKDLWAEHCNEYEYVDRQDEILISTFKSLTMTIAHCRR